jgi:hypothetical protein
MTFRLLTLSVLCAMLLSACGRPLSDSETRFAATIMGDQWQPEKVRIVRGTMVGDYTTQRQKRPRLTCRERIWPEPTSNTVTVSTAAVVLFDTMFVHKDIYKRDFIEGYPEKFDLAYAMLFAHEMTHVWQWQNRDKTDYHPLKAASEHKPGGDPYLLDLTSQADFLDYPYEQQGAIVEEYVCCRSLDPTGSRTKRLHKMLSAHMPLSRVDALPQSRIRLPWDGVTLPGICS